MKTLIKMLCVAMFTIVLTSCESKTGEVKSFSPDSSSIITVKGTKQGLDPWKLSIEINKKEVGQTEMYNDQLSEKNVLFDWENNHFCTITFVEQDGANRKYQVDLKE